MRCHATRTTLRTMLHARVTCLSQRRGRSIQLRGAEQRVTSFRGPDGRPRRVMLRERHLIFGKMQALGNGMRHTYCRHRGCHRGPAEHWARPYKLGVRNSLYRRRDWARRLHHRGGYNRSCAQIREAVDGDVVDVVSNIADVPHAGDVYVADVGSLAWYHGRNGSFGASGTQPTEFQPKPKKATGAGA